MKTARLLVLATLLPAFAQLHAQKSAGTNTAVAPNTSPQIAALFKLTRAELSGDRAKETVAFMDKYFRWPGNTGFNASLDRVESILRAAGYVREDSAPAKATLTYRIESKAMNSPAWDPADASITVVGESVPLMQWSTNRNMLAINSWSTPDSGVVGDIVLLAGGTAQQIASQLDSAKVRGKLVVAPTSLGRLYTEAVVKRGALGAMAYSMPAYTQPDVHVNSVQFTSVPYDTVGKSFGIALSKHGFDGIKAAVARGNAKVRVKTKTRMFPSTNRTVIAEVHGTVAPNERFVISAHVQEPGANDNASGVGDLSEMARVLGKLTKSGAIAPKRTITMLFGNEIQQTNDYLSANAERTKDVHWGLSLDMVGEDTKKTGGTFLIEKMPDPSAIWTRGEDKHSEWGGSAIGKDRLTPHYFNDYLLSRCLDQAAGAPGWVVKTNPFEGGSDHTPFLTFKKPGVLFWHFTDVYYHTDGDRIDMVSPVTLVNVANAALVSALTLTSADGDMARSLIAEQERAAVARLDVEVALSKKALATGGDAAKERDILETWTDYYLKALATMSDIETGGSSDATKKAITDAQQRVDAAGKARVAQIAK